MNRMLACDRHIGKVIEDAGSPKVPTYLLLVITLGENYPGSQQRGSLPLVWVCTHMWICSLYFFVGRLSW